MGFESIEEAEDFVDAVDWFYDVAKQHGGSWCATTHSAVCVAGRPYAGMPDAVLVECLNFGGGTAHDEAALELEFRGVAVWRCDGCDRWLEEGEQAHVRHSVDCKANGS